MLTISQIEKCNSTCKNLLQLTNSVNKFFEIYKIVSPEEMSAFLSQCGHESNDFNSLEENLNYSANALRATWPSRFPTDAIANEYARHPEKIANKVYSSRLSNGDESSGDGWKYQGRGAIQLTGKSNYQAFARYKNVDVNTLPTYLITIEGAVESACWYWGVNNLNKFASDVTTLTKKINGGLIGLEDRKQRYEKCIDILSNK
jgi:putative chitinase